jgi:15-cis-phytoene synthase
VEHAVTLQHSYSFSERIARSRARNFYYSFLLLSREQRLAMCAIYAFMRYCDDISEGEGASPEAIERWRRDLDCALAGRYGENALWPAFHDTVERFKIPHEYFYEMIAGVGSDLQPKQLATFDELYRYCYQVASVVGLTIIHIFGFDSPDALMLAEKCGIAFQLTNILRDVREDRENGRVYLPSEDIRQFGADLSLRDDRFVQLMAFEAARARAYYDESRPLLGLLTRIERSHFNVLEKRIRVPAWEKLSILATAALR